MGIHSIDSGGKFQWSRKVAGGASKGASAKSGGSKKRKDGNRRKKEKAPSEEVKDAGPSSPVAPAPEPKPFQLITVDPRWVDGTETGRRSLQKRETKPVATSSVKIRKLLDEGVKEMKKEPVIRERPQLWTHRLKKEEEEEEDDPFEDHPDWTNCLRTYKTPADHTSKYLLPQPLPLNFDGPLNDFLMKKKAENLEMNKETWKGIDWMGKKREDHQTLPKYVRPALLAEYKQAMEEIEQMKKGIYPKSFEAELKKMMDETAEREEEMRRIHMRKYTEKKNALDSKFGKGTTKQSRVLQARRDEIQAWLLEDLEESIRNIDIEIGSSDMYVGAGNSGKKYLRSGRPVVSSVPCDFVPEMEDAPKKRKPNMQPLSYLLGESGIYRDLRRLGMLDLLHGRAVSTYKATIDNQKLTYEGRSYPRGQPLFIQTEAYPWFPVLILSMSEGWVQFRSSIPGDTRCVTATIEDLEAGRVLVSKLPRDANAPPPPPVPQSPSYNPI